VDKYSLKGTAMKGKKAIVTYDCKIVAIKEDRELPFSGGEVRIVDVEGDNICICQPIGYPDDYTFTINKCYLKTYEGEV
jgi:hypothetical protein